MSTCSPCMYYRGINVVLFNQGLVEKQLFITDERVTLNKYISNIFQTMVHTICRHCDHNAVVYKAFFTTIYTGAFQATIQFTDCVNVGVI